MSTNSLLEEELFVNEIAALVTELRKVSFKTEADLAKIILIAMKFVSTFTKLDGLSKKQIVIASLKKIVEEQYDIESTDQTMLLNLIDVVASGIIDTIFAAASGKLVFNPKGGFCCFSAR